MLTNPRKFLIYSVPLVFLIMFIGLSLVDYSSVRALLIGIIVALLIFLLLKLLERSFAFGCVTIFLFAILIYGIFFTGLFMIGHPLANPLASVEIDEYSVIVQPSDERFTTFTIQETLTVDGLLVQLPERQVSGIRRGFALSELYFEPMQADFVITTTISKVDMQGWYTPKNTLLISDTDYIMISGDKDSSLVSVTLLKSQEPLEYLFRSYVMWYLRPIKSNVEIRNLPNGAFQQPDAQKFEVRSYLNTQTASWPMVTTDPFDSRVAFSYVNHPYYYMTPLLKPFIGVTSFGPWIVSIIGTILTSVFLIVVGVFQDSTKDYIKSIFTKKPQQPPTKDTPKKISIFGPTGEKLAEVEDNSDKPQKK